MIFLALHGYLVQSMRMEKVLLHIFFDLNTPFIHKINRPINEMINTNVGKVRVGIA